MTLTDAMMGAAALWLLFVLCGTPGQRADTSVASWKKGAAMGITPNAGIDIAPYSVWYAETEQPRHVTPPLPENGVGRDDPGDAGSGAPLPENVYSSLGSATVSSVGLPQVLSLTEVTIEPGGRLTLTNPRGSGLIVVEAGWLELTERRGNALLSRAPLAESPALVEEESLPTMAPGDRLSFGPGATIVLVNRGEHPATVLAASVMAMPVFAA